MTSTLELKVETVPYFSTVGTRKLEIPKKHWRAMLHPSVEPYEIVDVHAIDAVGVNRVQASQHFAKRTDYTFEALLTTLLVERKTSVILDIHCSMKQPHVTHVGWPVLTRNVDKLTAVSADKGYDWERLRTGLRAEAVTPLTHSEIVGCGDGRETCSSVTRRITNARTLNRCFWSPAQIRRRALGENWLGKFRERVMKSAGRNIKRTFEDSHP